MIDARLYVCARGDEPDALLTSILEAGVDVLQLRMKDAPRDDVLREAERFKAVCAGAGVPFIVNDDPSLAAELDADGVHLGQDDVAPAEARELLGAGKLIGRSTHSDVDIARALGEHEDGLADYIAVGPVHETPTKPGRAAVGYDLLRYAATAVDFPWFAIGGLDATNVADVVAAGASRIVVVRAVLDATDPAAATRELREALG